MVEVRGSGGGRSGTAVQEQQPDLLAALQRQWITVLVVALLGTAAGWVVSEARSSTFQARATLLLIAAGDEQDPGGGRNRTLDVETWATVARSTSLLQEVADALDRDLADVRSRTTAQAAPTGDVLILAFDAGDAATSVLGAQEYAERFLEARRVTVNQDAVLRLAQLEALQDTLETQIAQIAEQIDREEARGDLASATQLNLLTATQQRAIDRLADVNDELATLETDAPSGRILIDPSTAVSQTGLSRSLTTLAGLVLGVLLGLIVALLRDRYDDRYASEPSPSRLGIRELARVPYRRAGASARADRAHAYSRLITRLTFAHRREGDGGRAVLLLPVDSRSLPEDAADSVAASLASSADLTGILLEVWQDSIEMEARPGHWAETIDDVNVLREHNDLVLVPVPGLDRSAAGIGLAALVDDTVLLVAEGTPMPLVLDALDDLHAVGAPDVQVLVVTGVGRLRAPRPVMRVDDELDVRPATS